MFAELIERLCYCVFTINRITLYGETNYPTIEILLKSLYIAKDIKCMFYLQQRIQSVFHFFSYIW